MSTLLESLGLDGIFGDKTKTARVSSSATGEMMRAETPAV